MNLRRSLIAPLTFAFVLSSAATFVAQEHKDAPAKDTKGKPEEKAAGDKDKWAPLPADKTIDQSINLNGKTLSYKVTVGTLPARDSDGKVIGQIVYTAYIVDGKDRPVTFAMNGGPGASSVYLNLGAIGPKKVRFGLEGDSPSDPATLVDNPGTWLDFTDLVFIDPIGTGFSRTLTNLDDTKKYFWNAQSDITYLSRSIYDWLVKYERLQSRKYYVGESYGGYRGPRIAHTLQVQMGVALNGVTLVSPYLNPAQDEQGDLSPVPWMMTLPSIAAAYQERQHTLSASSMASVIKYTRTDYATALMEGRSNPAATDAMVKHVAEITGLDPVYVKRAGGRLETQAYLREVFRSEGRLGSRYDPNVTAYDPFPNDPDQRSNDPILESIIAPTTTAMVDFVTRVVGWKVDAPYEALSYTVNRNWDHGGNVLRRGAVEDLREAVSADPKMRVSIVHGWNDLSCPFMGSILTVDQMPAMGEADRVHVYEYPGGHMFYSRQDSQLELKKDIQAMYAKH